MKISPVEMTDLFSPVLIDWLDTLGCEHLHVAYARAPDDNKQDAAFDTSETTLVLGDAMASDWKVTLECASDNQPSQNGLEKIAAYCEWMLAISVQLPEERSAVVVDVEQARKIVHALRNRLNSLLLNTAVIAGRLQRDGDNEKFLDQIEGDGRRCAQHLEEFYTMIRPPAPEH